ncbi:hypothetical protein CONPUDRAFT_79311 [Coniophora puteana RWD-64-598 SS2]|uniref:Uncharacterized protein n=1 Tax=Coniophora puteana (strain RWD-64-598) TaxID=741705 RepID=A0A5M3N6U1_CONPW|nr:uncharacterized protein CONPUDRAFT_79311 [Coniophora puteana RWD-64-598 SS2]EIW87152.1 hypothetical protein CONPUDRAFT_79311 [Coniophora puteana RWD-64-598 SS2]
MTRMTVFGFLVASAAFASATGVNLGAQWANVITRSTTSSPPNATASSGKNGGGCYDGQCWDYCGDTLSGWCYTAVDQGGSTQNCTSDNDCSIYWACSSDCEAM